MTLFLTHMVNVHTNKSGIVLLYSLANVEDIARKTNLASNLLENRTSGHAIMCRADVLCRVPQGT